MAAEKSIYIMKIGRMLGMSQQSISQMLKLDSIKFVMVMKIADALETGLP